MNYTVDEVISTGNDLTSMIQLINSTDLSADNGEGYESELVKIENITVDSVDNYGNFTINDSNGTAIVSPINENDLEVGSTYTSITGVVSYSYGAYKIIPRDTNDIVVTN